MTRLSAVQAASDALNELGMDQSTPVDPFEAIENAGLVLSFQSLPVGDTPESASGR